MNTPKSHFILYVRNQSDSTEFYTAVLAQKPSLNVPGMTEFTLNQGCILGLMPEEGIKRLLGDSLPDPSKANGIPRSEVYMMVDNPEAYQSRAIENGATELSPLTKRNWGDEAAYSLDKDGHVLAFARATTHASS